MENNPFTCHVGAELQTVEIVRSVRVDRSDETKTCVEALVGRRQNVLIPRALWRLAAGGLGLTIKRRT